MSIDHRRSIGSRLTAFAGGLAVLALAACAEPTPYAPRTADNSTGYSDQQLAANRYRITFTGNSVTSRETVENYLLLRAAEVTQSAGYSKFVFDTRDTKANTSYRSYSDYPYYSYFGYPYGGYGGYGYGYGYGGHGYGGYGYGDSYSRPITRYQAYAEIVVLSDAEAKTESRAMSASDVVAHLRPAASQPASAPASSYR